ncbi:Chitinase A1 [Escovopsis weberi]|uniref:chitinase n=1 Tax=Escovopsis weberi TaxID=150374 RepID=A0A0M9VVP8_ESCWE|nr:Chitinase A1 [Escovopsis weberi]
MLPLRPLAATIAGTAATLSLSLSLSLSLAPPPAAAAEPFLYIGYCPSWNPAAIEATDFSPYTHVNIAFAIPQADGSLVLENEGQLGALAARIRAQGAKALVAVGGYTGSAAFGCAAADAGRAAALSAAIVGFVGRHGLDGVDIDWEYPAGAGDVANLVTFLATLRGAFDAGGSGGGGGSSSSSSSDDMNRNADDDDGVFKRRGSKRRGNRKRGGEQDRKIISMAVPAMPYPGLTPQQARDMSALVDYISLMQYDINGPWAGETGPNAPFDFEAGRGLQVSFRSSIEAWRALGWPAERMVAGLAFYGRAARALRDMNAGTRGDAAGNTTAAGDDAAAEGTGNPGAQYAAQSAERVVGDRDDACCATGTWKWKWLRQDILTGGVEAPAAPWVRHWDGVSQTPWLFNSETMVYITYEDPASIARKARHAYEEGLRGVMAWSLEMEWDNELVSAAKELC